MKKGPVTINDAKLADPNMVCAILMRDLNRSENLI